MATSRWKFQIKPNQRGILGVGYRMDSVGEAVEWEVNDAMLFPFKFHKINKIVMCLGPAPNEKDYSEVLGVGLKQWPEFDITRYSQSSDSEKVAMLRGYVLRTFEWLENGFTDAQFVSRTRAKLNWAN